MDTAVAAVLVESELADRYRFAHALIQHSLYDELSRPAVPRPSTHRTTLETDTTPTTCTTGELAHHWNRRTRRATSTRRSTKRASAGRCPRRARPDERSAGITSLDLLAARPRRNTARAAPGRARTHRAELRNPSIKTPSTSRRLAEELGDTDTWSRRRWLQCVVQEGSRC